MLSDCVMGGGARRFALRDMMKESRNFRWWARLGLLGCVMATQGWAADGDSTQLNPAALIKASAALGELGFTQLVAAPFPHPARANGHVYHGTFYTAAEHYASSTVAFFVPKGFRATETVDLVIHFHGWNHNVYNTLEEYKLISQLVESGKNAVLVVPEGPENAPDSFGGKLEDPQGFARFVSETVSALQHWRCFAGIQLRPGKIILSGHSGGYHVIAAILDRGGMPEAVKEVWLFDALYEPPESFAAWQAAQRGRLINIYTDHGGTRELSEGWLAACHTNGTSWVAAEETHSRPAEWLPGHVVFLHSDLAHNQVIYERHEFATFLRTSVLDNIHE